MGGAVDKRAALEFGRGSDDRVGIRNPLARLPAEVQRRVDHLLGDRHRLVEQLGVAGKDFPAGTGIPVDFFQPDLDSSQVMALTRVSPGNCSRMVSTVSPPGSSRQWAKSAEVSRMKGGVI